MVKGRQYCMASRILLSQHHFHWRDLLPRCALLRPTAPPHLPLKCRLWSAAAAASAPASDSFAHSPYALIQATETLLESLHQHSHLPWWVVIAGTTLVLRGGMTLPLAVYQAKMAAKQELLLPRMKELQNAALHSVVVKCRKANLPHTEANRIFRKEVSREVVYQLNKSPCLFSNLGV